MKGKLNIFIIFLATISGPSVSIECSNVFPGPLNITSTTGSITFNACSIIQGSSTILVTPDITTNASCSKPTCNTAACTKSGGTAAQLSLGTFQTANSGSSTITVNQNTTMTIDNNGNSTTSYNSITLSGSSNLTFSANSSSTTLYKIQTLTLNNGNNVINFVPGDYWIQNFNCNSDATFNVAGTGTVRLYFQNGFNTSGTQNWNYNSSAVNSNPTSNQLLIVSYGGINFNNTANINGLIYTNGSIIFNSSGTINGAVTATNATLQGATNIQFNSSAVNNLNFGSLCSSSNAVHFSVTAPSTGTNCQNMTVTVTALDSSNQTVTTYTNGITLSTQSGYGTWISTTGKGNFSVNSNTGTATYQFDSADKGVAAFQLNYPAAGSSPITIKAFETNNTSVTGLSNTVNFIPTSFLVTDSVVSNPPASPPSAFSTAQTAGNDFILKITAYNQSNCGIITSYSGSKTLRFWTNFVNPTTGTLNASINSTNIANNQAASQTTQVINFTNGVATVTGNYPDVGILMLNVQDVTSSGPSGASGNFVVKPAQFIVNIPNDNASQVFSPIGSAISACLADGVFAAAGRPFTVNVQPQNMQGNATPNYGNETPAQGIIIQSAALLAPNPGKNGSANNGIIGNGSAFTKITGGASPFSPSSLPYFTGSNFSFDEVGCISLTASVAGGSYLGAGNVVSNPLVVGRFIPDHFDATSNVPQFLTPNNSDFGSFTYLDQPFKYNNNTQPILTIVARALSGTTTQNYTGSFWKLTSMNFHPQYFKLITPITATDSLPELTLFPVIPTPTFVDVGNGTGTFTYDGGSLTIQRPTLLPLKPVPPFKADIQLQIPTITDPDGVSCSGVGCTLGGFAFGSLSLGGGIPFTGNGIGNQFFHGRLNVFDTIGSELLSMRVPLQTEFYTTANGFSINKLDSNTTLSSIASVLLTPNPPGLSTNKSFIGPSEPSTNKALNPATGLLQFGSISINLTPPTLNGVSTAGFFGIEVDLSATGLNLPWLQFNWTYNGPATAYNVNPRAAAIFGVFEGNSRIIYEAEIFQ